MRIRSGATHVKSVRGEFRNALKPACCLCFARARKIASMIAVMCARARSHIASSIEARASIASYADANARSQAESVFFSWLWCNRIVVQVDSRLHCSDTATHSWLGGQHGEEEKSSEESEEGEAGEEAPVVVFRSSTAQQSRIGSTGAGERRDVGCHAIELRRSGSDRHRGRRRDLMSLRCPHCF